MDRFTCKVYQIDKAPKRITLEGDKTKKVEAAQHAIEFPGGAVEVSRTSTGEYWAHIHVYKGQVIEDTEGLCSAMGTVVCSRLEYGGSPEDVPNAEAMTHIALLIHSEAP